MKRSQSGEDLKEHQPKDRVMGTTFMHMAEGRRDELTEGGRSRIRSDLKKFGFYLRVMGMVWHALT